MPHTPHHRPSAMTYVALFLTLLPFVSLALTWLWIIAGGLLAGGASAIEMRETGLFWMVIVTAGGAATLLVDALAASFVVVARKIRRMALLPGLAIGLAVAVLTWAWLTGGLPALS